MVDLKRKTTRTHRVWGYLTAFLPVLAVSSAVASIKNSVHDFSDEGWSNGEICIVCHTPHGGAPDVAAPLWNHVTTQAVYELYDSPSMDAEVEQLAPGSNSRMCLSCHDGTTAVDAYGGNGGSYMAPESVVVGTDLSNDHPVGIRYSHQTGGSCRNQCHNFEYSPTPGPWKEVKFYDGRVECSSCHDVHNNVAKDVKLLRKTMQGSALCLNCHE